MKFGSSGYMELLYAEASRESPGDNPCMHLHRVIAWYESNGFDGDNLVRNEPHAVAALILAIWLQEQEVDEPVDITGMLASAFSSGLEAGVRLGKARWGL